MEEKDDEDATSTHCNKKEKLQTSSLLLQLPLPKKNDEKKIVQTSIISAHNCQAGDRLQSSWSTTMM
jgi:hypothetical protein